MMAGSPQLLHPLPHAQLTPPLSSAPQLFENQLDAWMAEFHHYLTYGHPGLAESDPEKEGVLEGLQVRPGTFAAS